MVDISSYKNLFIKTASEQIKILEKYIANLRDDKDLDTSLSVIYRCFHSLRSEAAIMQCPNIAQISEFFEKEIDKIKTQKRVSTNQIDMLKHVALFLTKTISSFKTTNKELPLPRELLTKM